MPQPCQLVSHPVFARPVLLGPVLLGPVPLGPVPLGPVPPGPMVLGPMPPRWVQPGLVVLGPPLLGPPLLGPPLLGRVLLGRVLLGAMVLGPEAPRLGLLRRPCLASVPAGWARVPRSRRAGPGHRSSARPRSAVTPQPVRCGQRGPAACNWRWHGSNLGRS